MSRRYQPYQSYQNSYAVWSGKVPEHWKPIRLKHVFGEKKKHQNPDLPAGSISFGNVVFKNEDSLAKETKAAYQELLSGEFLVNPLNMNFDLMSLRTALSDIDVVVSTGILGSPKYRWIQQKLPSMATATVRCCSYENAGGRSSPDN